MGDNKQENVNSESNVNEEEEEEDPYVKRIDNSGCAKYHYALQVL